MANIIVTTICNLRCPYCFADEHLQTTRQVAESRFISLDGFEARLDFLERSGIDEIRLIGGEPTLHPQFTELIARAQRRGKRILVFSHGLMRAAALACLETLPVEQCTVLVNMNASRNDGHMDKEQAQRRTTLQRLGERALPGFTIYQTTFDLNWLLPVIAETGCKKALRVGLAQPILGGSNAYLHPKQYPLVGQRLAQLARQAAATGIRLELDCGFVRCMFSDDDLQTLYNAHADVGWRCNPILDVAIDGQVMHCFPLAGKIEVSLTETTHAAEMREALSAQTEPFRVAGIYKECSTCPIRQRGECTGGCLAATWRRFRHSAIRITIPEQRLQPL